MFAIGMPVSSLRMDRAESSRLAWAFVLSLAAHLLIYGGYEAGRKLHVWEKVHWPAWMRPPRVLTELLIRPATSRKEREQLDKRPQQEIPLVFVEVSPAQAAPEPPKAPKYYSSRNSLAANPDSTVQSLVPKIDGKQTDMPKTEDVPRTRAFPLQPTPPKTPPAKPEPVKPEPAKAEPQPKPDEAAKPTEKEEAGPKPKPAQPRGDLAMISREQPSPKAQGEADRPKKRRRLSDVPREERMAALAGEKMRQDGGVARRELRASLDALASPFGDYDEIMIRAVQDQWYTLLDEQRFAGARTGKVVLRFHLNADGSVTQMQLLENTVDLSLALVCQRAIRDPAPFAPWPEDLRRLVGVNYREITFNFFYR